MTHDEFILDELIPKLVQLGHVTRRHKADGNLQSVAPPTFDGYFAALRMANRLPHWSLEQIAQVTLLGNAGADDRKHVAAVLSEVCGLEISDNNEAFPAENLF